MPRAKKKLAKLRGQKLSGQLRTHIRRSEAQGLTRYRIARETGVGESTISRFMAGGTVSMDTLDQLALFLVWKGRAPRRKSYEIACRFATNARERAKVDAKFQAWQAAETAKAAQRAQARAQKKRADTMASRIRVHEIEQEVLRRRASTPDDHHASKNPADAPGNADSAGADPGTNRHFPLYGEGTQQKQSTSFDLSLIGLA
jgi:transcriptional regulator with XRE-family HTH domain